MVYEFNVAPLFGLLLIDSAILFMLYFSIVGYSKFNAL